MKIITVQTPINFLTYIILIFFFYRRAMCCHINGSASAHRLDAPAGCPRRASTANARGTGPDHRPKWWYYDHYHVTAPAEPSGACATDKCGLESWQSGTLSIQHNFFLFQKFYLYSLIVLSIFSQSTFANYKP